jgi:hypothetical protein
VRAQEPGKPLPLRKETPGFIAAGWVDPASLKFTAERVRRVRDDAPEKHRTLEVLYEERVADLYREHPMVDGADLAAGLTQLLSQENEQELARG